MPVAPGNALQSWNPHARMANWKVVAAVVAAAVAATLAGAYFGMMAYYRRRERTRISAACAPLSADTIFVTLVSHTDPYAAAETLVSLFERAHCPLRVYVGVFELHGRRHATTVMEEYELQCKFSRSPFCLKDHVRIIRIPVLEDKGILAACEQVERHLYKGERFACTVASGVELAQNWDAYAVDTLRLASLAAKSSKVVLSSMCDADTPATGAPGTYCGLHESGVLLGYKFKHLPPRPVPALAWSSFFSFSGSARLAEAPYERLPDDRPECVDRAAHDMYMTIRLLHRRWTVMHPPGMVVAWRRGGVIGGVAGEGTERWRLNVRGVNAARAGACAAFQHMGIVSKAGDPMRLSARARLGLTPAADECEIVAKIGSMGDYLSILSRMELLQHHQ